MHVTLKAIPLQDGGGPILRKLIAADRSNQSVDALVAHILQIGGRWAVVEDPYTDLDYSADYLGFYAGAFKNYPRHTRRIHIFAEDVTDILEGSFAEQQEAFQSRTYLGFVVLRPISQGPIGRTVLRFPTLDDGLTVRPAARADFPVHLLGSRLTATGAPFIQQEARVGACAQAAIWMSSLAVHARHRRTAWHPVSEITRLATTPTDPSLSQALPAGSAGLNPAHMIRALSAMGHQPLFDLFRVDPGQPQPSAAAMVFRYLDSGLPVILTMDVVDHAIAAVGYVESDGPAVRQGDTYDSFVRALVVHDDQRGPYRLMALTAEDANHLPQDRLLMHGSELLTVESAVSHMFVPLPARVYLRADRADTVVKDFLTRHTAQLGAQLEGMLAEGASADAAGAAAAFHEKVRAGTLVRRTYLTSAARYRYHLSKSDAADHIKAHALRRTLPHYVWVTELLDPDSPQTMPGGPRRIFGHMVVNATSSSNPDSDLLFAHLPHVALHRDVNPPDSYEVDFDEEAVLVDIDRPYAGRHRT